MPEIRLKCTHCGHEEKTISPCPYTGYEYNSGWVTTCPHCRSNMVRVPDKKE